MRGVIQSCAAPDDDPYAQCLGVCCQEEADGDGGGGGGGVYWGEMGEGQMNGLGRVETGSATYVGFWERGMYQGPGLLLDHDEGTRQEGVFRDGALAEGSSTSASVDRQGRRARDGVRLEGPGVKVLRDAVPAPLVSGAAVTGPPPPGEQQQQQQQLRQRLRVRALRGAFAEDQLDGRGSAWNLLGPVVKDGEGGPGSSLLAGGGGRAGPGDGYVLCVLWNVDVASGRVARCRLSFIIPLTV